ncbi:MAG: hypothetical protein HFJ35_02520 [Clostridia bacterium]|nr:hypothetical protein [Clostridia bacterium]
MEVNHVYMSPKQYSEATGNKIGIEEIKRLCRIGRIPCEMTKKGYYKIKVYKDNCVSREEYDRVIKENNELKQLLKTINNISNYKEG